MVISKIKELFREKNDEKYEILFHKYSQLKLNYQKMKEKHNEELRELKDKILLRIIDMLLNLEDDIEEAKNSSFKVTANTKEIQKLLVDLNKIERTMNKILEKLSVEEIMADERYYDPELHEVSSYTDNKGMEKGIILKTVKKGWKYKGKVLRKPKVLVTK